jgi:hypothetical protein
VGVCVSILSGLSFNAAVSRGPGPSGPPGTESLSVPAGVLGLLHTGLRGRSTVGG